MSATRSGAAVSPDGALCCAFLPPEVVHHAADLDCNAARAVMDNSPCLSVLESRLQHQPLL